MNVTQPCLRRCASSKRSGDNRRSFVRFFRHSSADTTTQHNVPCLCCCCFCRTMFQFLVGDIFTCVRICMFVCLCIIEVILLFLSFVFHFCEFSTILRMFWLKYSALAFQNHTESFLWFLKLTHEDEVYGFIWEREI